jgi:hypothetical protein
VDELSDEDTIPVVAPQAAAAATVVAGEGEKEGSEGDEEEAPVEGSRYTFNIADDGLRWGVAHTDHPHAIGLTSIRVYWGVALRLFVDFSFVWFLLSSSIMKCCKLIGLQMLHTADGKYTCMIWAWTDIDV